MRLNGRLMAIQVDQGVVAVATKKGPEAFSPRKILKRARIWTKRWRRKVPLSPLVPRGERGFFFWDVYPGWLILRDPGLV